MANLLELIKIAGTQAVDASNPVSILYGEVTKSDPLEVNVDQRFTLTRDFLIVPDSLTRYEIQLQHNHSYAGGTTEESLTNPIVIREGLQVGDKVILVRVQGGQQYVVLDKVAEL